MNRKKDVMDRIEKLINMCATCNGINNKIDCCVDDCHINSKLRKALAEYRELRGEP